MHWRGHRRSGCRSSRATRTWSARCAAELRRPGRPGACSPASTRRCSCSTPASGFAKTAAHNWQLLRKLDVFVSLGFPILVGASRKRFLGALLADDEGTPRRPDGREHATAAVTALAANAGAWGVRVHEVAASLDAVAVAAAWHWGTSRARNDP